MGIHLSLVQTLVWIGLSMWNKNASLWFGETLFGGDGTAAAGTPDKIAFDHGIAAFSVAGIYQSVFQIVASLALMVIVSKPGVSLRLLYVFCLLVGTLASIWVYQPIDVSVAQAVSVVEKLSEVASFIVPFALVVLASKKAEQTGETVSTALCMAYLNCSCTLGQFVQMALTSLFCVFLPDGWSVSGTCVCLCYVLERFVRAISLRCTG